MALIESPTSSVSRDYLLDNLKFILITLVVFGHFIQPHIDQSVALKAVFFCIYSFHMPLFIFISGYFSKSQNTLSYKKNVSAILLPYILFSILWSLQVSIRNKHLSFDIFIPPFHLWYLLSLFTWRVLLPYVQTLKFPIIFTVMLSLIVGLSPSIGWEMSLSRTITLFPFFILGSKCSPTILHRIHTKKYFALVGFILLITLGYCVARFSLFNWSIFFWAQSYKEAGHSYMGGFALRSIAILLAIGIGLALIVLTPVKKVFFTSLGSRTMLVFILHGFFVFTFTRRFPFWDQSFVNDCIILLFPLLLVYVLSQPIFEKYYQKIMNVISSWVMDTTRSI